MAKNTLLAILTNIVNLIVAIGIGGLFVGGALTGVAILSALPLIAHQVVGWFVIATAVWGFIMSLQ